MSRLGYFCIALTGGPLCAAVIAGISLHLGGSIRIFAIALLALPPLFAAGVGKRLERSSAEVAVAAILALVVMVGLYAALAVWGLSQDTS